MAEQELKLSFPKEEKVDTDSDQDSIESDQGGGDNHYLSLLKKGGGQNNDANSNKNFDLESKDDSEDEKSIIPEKKASGGILDLCYVLLALIFVLLAFFTLFIYIFGGSANVLFGFLHFLLATSLVLSANSIVVPVFIVFCGLALIYFYVGGGRSIFNFFMGIAKWFCPTELKNALSHFSNQLKAQFKNSSFYKHYAKYKKGMDRASTWFMKFLAFLGVLVKVTCGIVIFSPVSPGGWIFLLLILLLPLLCSYGREVALVGGATDPDKTFNDLKREDKTYAKQRARYKKGALKIPERPTERWSDDCVACIRAYFYYFISSIVWSGKAIAYWLWWNFLPIYAVVIGIAGRAVIYGFAISAALSAFSLATGISLLLLVLSVVIIFVVDFSVHGAPLVIAQNQGVSNYIDVYNGIEQEIKSYQKKHPFFIAEGNKSTLFQEIRKTGWMRTLASTVIPVIYGAGKGLSFWMGSKTLLYFFVQSSLLVLPAWLLIALPIVVGLVAGFAYIVKNGGIFMTMYAMKFGKSDSAVGHEITLKDLTMGTFFPELFSKLFYNASCYVFNQDGVESKKVAANNLIDNSGNSDIEESEQESEDEESEDNEINGYDSETPTI